MSDAVFDIAGLRLRSPIVLAAPAADDADADIEVVIAPPGPVPMQRPSAEVIAERRDDTYAYYTFCRVPEGIVARFFGLAEFFISESLDRVTAQRSPDTDPEYQSILLAGSVAAFLHAARGRTVLHASAVRVGGSTIAFVGPSNQGKTTLAALFCAAGASLVADDVLVVDVDGDGSVVTRRGGTELRIRADAHSIVERFGPEITRRSTIDGRIAVSPQTVTEPRTSLSAIVFPRPIADAETVATRRLGGGEAALLLAGCQRIEGWRDGRVLRRQFDDVTRVVSRVPVVELTMPWGPPYHPELAAVVMEACGVQPDPDGKELVR